MNNEIRECIKQLNDVNEKIGEAILEHLVDWTGDNVSAILTALTYLNLFLKVSEGGMKENVNQIREHFSRKSKALLTSNGCGSCKYLPRGEIIWLEIKKYFNEHIDESLDLSNAHLTGKLMGLSKIIKPIIEKNIPPIIHGVDSGNEISHITTPEHLSILLVQSILAELTR